MWFLGYRKRRQKKAEDGIRNADIGLVNLPPGLDTDSMRRGTPPPVPFYPFNMTENTVYDSER